MPRRGLGKGNRSNPSKIPSILARKRRHDSESQEGNKRRQTSMDDFYCHSWRGPDSMPDSSESDLNETISIASSTCLDTDFTLSDMTFIDNEIPQTWSRFRQLSCLPLKVPLPSLSWADPNEVWGALINRDLEHVRDPNMLKRHPALQSRMRSILLDWLIEVCEVYKMHRETYYLAQDFIDRYLSYETNIPKQKLQLIGVTSLFMAAKIEEIYPPKVSEFAFVTDGACTEDEILEMELIIMKALKWDMSPVTVNGWLAIFLQLHSLITDESKENKSPDCLITPNYLGSIHSIAAQLLDLATLDINSLKYHYSVLAATAVYLTVCKRSALQVSGYEWNDLSPCVQWMVPFHNVLKQSQTLHNHIEDHSIQTHTTDLKLLESVQELENQIVPPKSPLNVSGILTPPQSAERQDKHKSLRTS